MMRAAIPAAAAKPLMAVWRAAAPALELDVLEEEPSVDEDVLLAPPDFDSLLDLDDSLLEELEALLALEALLELALALFEEGAVAWMGVPLAEAEPPMVEVTRKAEVIVLPPSVVPVEVVAKVVMVSEPDVVIPVEVRPGAPAP